MLTTCVSGPSNCGRESQISKLRTSGAKNGKSVARFFRKRRVSNMNPRIQVRIVGPVYKHALFFFVGLTVCSQAAMISVSDYTYSTLANQGPSPHSGYGDTASGDPTLGGGELTDSTITTAVWPNPFDNTPVVGFLDVDPTITFNFGSTQTIQKVSLWMADSGGASGVALPTHVRIRTPDGTTFNRQFTVIDPEPGESGSTVRLDFVGFSVTTDSLVVETTRGAQWTMLSEVSFDSVPESVAALFSGVGALLLLRRRR